MFEFCKNRRDSVADKHKSAATPVPPFTFGNSGSDSYQYPCLYDEANEMLQVSMLIYSITDLRSLAKNAKMNDKLKSPETILDMPLTLTSCLKILNDNYDVMKDLLGENDHVYTMNSLNLIHERFQRHYDMTSLPSSSGYFDRIINLIPTTSVIHSSRDIEVEQISPILTFVGDDDCDVDMVYAIGIDQARKRVTLAFRGSVTPTDFQKDAMISLNQQHNPLHDTDSDQPKQIGVHHGFYEYLLRPRKNGKNKYQEIKNHVENVFLEYEYCRDYKLYVTGHSLGGALATLFSLYAASSAGSHDAIIPLPISCISIASPRVGDLAFQAAFCRLEEMGRLRHLRIANDGDPVTMMPNATSKRILARLSPVSYLAFKLMDNQFEEKERFFHTGIKLRLAKNKWELSFLGTPMISSEREIVEINSDTASCDTKGSIKSSTSLRSIMSRSTRQDSFQQTSMPDAFLHLGNAYSEHLCSVKNELCHLSLNKLYTDRALSIFLEKNVEK